MPEAAAKVTVEQALPIIDRISQQSDRWLFIALLSIGLIAIWILARYFARKQEVLEVKLDKVNEYVRDTLSQMITKTNSIMEANTQAFRDIEERLRKNA